MDPLYDLSFIKWVFYRKHLVRELGIGLNMDHKNVIRLFGYTLDNTGENSSLIMPFYANGDAVAFIQDGTADRPRLVRDLLV